VLCLPIGEVAAVEWAGVLQVGGIVHRVHVLPYEPLGGPEMVAGEAMRASRFHPQVQILALSRLIVRHKEIIGTV
jgi:hypothetical protein